MPKKSKEGLERPSASETSADGFYLQSHVCKVLGCNFHTLQTAIRTHAVTVRKDGKVNIDEMKSYLDSKLDLRQRGLKLSVEKKAAEIAKLKSATEKQELEKAVMRGEMHPTKECSRSLGHVLTTVWMEIMALPSRIQAAFPEIPNVEKVVTEIVNDSASKLQDYAKARAGSELPVTKSS